MTLCETETDSTEAQHAVLVVDADALRVALIRDRLTAAGVTVRTTTNVSAALASVTEGWPDVILIDLDIQDIDGFSLATLFRCEAPLVGVAIMLVTSRPVDEDDRQLAAASGAQMLIERSETFDRELAATFQLLRGEGGDGDAILRPTPHVRRLTGQIGRLLARSQDADARCHSVLDNILDAVGILTPDGIILDVNRGCEQMLQTPRDEMVGHHIREFAPPGHADSNVAEYHDALDSGAGRMRAIPIARPDGTCVYVEWSNKAVSLNGKDVVIAVGRDVTERVEARRKEAASEERYRTLMESIPDVVWSSTLTGKLLFISPTVERICGFPAGELAAAPESFWFERVHPEDIDRVTEAFERVATNGYAAEYRWRHKDGHWIWLQSHARTRTTLDGTQLVEGTFADITELKRAEEHVRQSQKMEAIGQLTGGVAHDFNNILAVILGNGDFLRQSLSESDPRRADAEAILEAGQRAAGLTRQLLAFSRRQMLEPRILDLNQIVRGLEKMLRRIIGEDIEFSTALPDALDRVHADAGQIEQVIMNLVVNARDAMPVGGKLSIETANVVLDAAYCRTHLGAAAGPHVMLAVSDTGCGMDADTKRRLFEPFFTTKERGKGTGLGLSTCYGIVKQSGGWIWVYSERGQGTVFKVYLPVASADSARVSSIAAPVPSAKGHETVLVIEDDAQVRSMVRRILASNSYDILEARDGGEALALAHNHHGRIDLILSDVVIPGLSGPEIVQQVQHEHGSTRSLFMSGYTDHAVLRDRILAAGANFIQKPFAPAALANKVREVLDAPPQVTI
jgi:PAS domain S-box-containing protein